MKKLFRKIIGSRFARELKKMQPILDAIHQHEERLAGLSEDEIKGQTAKLRALIKERYGALEEELTEKKAAKHRCADPTERNALDREIHGLEDQLKDDIQAALKEVLPEAFATVREACRRLLGTKVVVTGHDMEWDMVPYDVQLIGGIVLHESCIAEMATGEGKTLVATLPMYLNALPGYGVHLVTVNDYLARRDSQWMGHVYQYLGLTVSCLDDTQPQSPERRAAYQADITYGTNHDFGFDYLRDNMVFSLDQRVQRGHNYTIIDEVDSILIDEARTPLIISGPAGHEGDEKYAEFNNRVKQLVKKQTAIVAEEAAKAEPLVTADEQDYNGAVGLFKAQRGMPRNKKLMKLLQEPKVQQAVQRVELDYIADRKLPSRDQRFRDVDDDLYYVLDERGPSSSSRTSRKSSARSSTTRNFRRRKRSSRSAPWRRSTRPSPRRSTSSTSSSRRIRCTRRTWSTSSRTARSSSSMSSPVARCRFGVGPTGCTRRWRRRKASPSAARRRPSPPSPSPPTSRSVAGMTTT